MAQLSYDTIKKIEQYINDGYIKRVKHPMLPLFLYKYTMQAQFDWFFPPEIRICRALVLDEKYNIVSRPFEKFFTYEQLQTMQIPIPNEPFTVYEKMDGSFIQMFIYRNQLIITSSGSFTSYHTLKAKEILNTQYSHVTFDLGKTYIFEIIFPENSKMVDGVAQTPIAVDYGDINDLFLLSIRDINANKDLPLVDIGFSIVKKYSTINSIESALQHDIDNKEGYVIHFHPSDFRMKIKFKTYLHKFRSLAYTSQKSLLRILMDKGYDATIEYIKELPDELYDWATSIVEEYQAKFDAIDVIAHYIYNMVSSYLYKYYGNDWGRKEYSIELDKISGTKYAALKYYSFFVFDGETETEKYKNAIWNIIYQRYRY